jgi:hypothetical protein
MKVENQKLAYFGYFLSIISHGIMFWVSSMDIEKYFISKRKPLGQFFL